MLDVISGGRLEFGVGRGYQPREAEVLGGPMGATIQDQERNRSYFEEAYEIIMKAWTEPSFSYHGEFYHVPPSYTKWNHNQTIAYFASGKAGHPVEDVLDIGPPDMYSTGSPVLASTTTLREISVIPQPLQKPHPQVWQPVTSPRSIDWAATRGVNCFTVPEPTSRLVGNVQRYYDSSAAAGWPDRLDRGEFKFGWDSDKRRGYGCCRYIHLLDPNDPKGDLERLKLGSNCNGTTTVRSASRPCWPRPTKTLPARYAHQRRPADRERGRDRRHARRGGREDHEDQGRSRLRRLPLHHLVRDRRLLARGD